MNYLVFDTETTSFPRKGMSATHPYQARVLQLAAIQLDENLNEVKTLSSLIKLPLGKVIDEGAFKAHGKTWEMCNEAGRNAKDVFKEFDEMFHASYCHIAHNKQFDDTMVGIEFDCLFMSYYYTPGICTMELTTSICKLPHAKKRAFGQAYKWPKLVEAYRHCFGKDFEGAHDALHDVRATAEVFKWLVREGHINLASNILKFPTMA